MHVCGHCISSAYVRAVTVEINSKFQCIKKTAKFATCGSDVSESTLKRIVFVAGCVDIGQYFAG